MPLTGATATPRDLPGHRLTEPSGTSDLFRKNEVATVAGLAGMMGNLGLLIFSLMIGGLVTRIGYDPFFVALGVLDLAGAAILWTLVRDRAPSVTSNP